MLSLGTFHDHAVAKGFSESVDPRSYDMSARGEADGLSLYHLDIHVSEIEHEKSTDKGYSKHNDSRVLFDGRHGRLAAPDKHRRHDGDHAVYVYHISGMENRLYHTEWTSLDNLSVSLNGMDLDTAWANTVKAIVCNEECGVWNEELSLNENLANVDEHLRIKKEIARLEALARKEKQPKKKFELVQKINAMRNSEFGIRNGGSDEE